MFLQKFQPQPPYSPGTQQSGQGQPPQQSGQGQPPQQSGHSQPPPAYPYVGHNQQPPSYHMYPMPTPMSYMQQPPMPYMQHPPMSYMQQPSHYQTPVYRPEMAAPAVFCPEVPVRGFSGMLAGGGFDVDFTRYLGADGGSQGGGSQGGERSGPHSVSGSYYRYLIYIHDWQSRRGDIISRLLAVRETDPKYLRDLIFSLFVAGKDSTASNLSWFVYLLCKHPHIQEKVAKEVREATNLKDDSSIDGLADSLSEEAINKMQYLFAALTETLRLYPSVPLNAKICSSDDTWPDGFSVKKGDMVGYHAYSMGRMKYLWGDDAEEFRPERWLNKDGIFQHESPFKFTAFSAGPRICVGKDIAHRETMIFSAVLLGSFIFKLSEENKVAHYTTKVTLHIDGGLYVHASPRFGHPRPTLDKRYYICYIIECITYSCISVVA
ncbi:hypothetical protein DVH24_022663 [Malus domestica]|uniref:Cytochrome P450 n=1 Tax=Malus domestica TaxID=3750 RepID=A0A498KK18_MALDO|nr:hypothetical protein DVH24_022663 [Malus domestica]